VGENEWAGLLETVLVGAKPLLTGSLKTCRFLDCPGVIVFTITILLEVSGKL
jgi:hypothetical protein